MNLYIIWKDKNYNKGCFDRLIILLLLNIINFEYDLDFNYVYLGMKFILKKLRLEVIININN